MRRSLLLLLALLASPARSLHVYAARHIVAPSSRRICAAKCSDGESSGEEAEAPPPPSNPFFSMYEEEELAALFKLHSGLFGEVSDDGNNDDGQKATTPIHDRFASPDDNENRVIVNVESLCCPLTLSIMADPVIAR